MIIDRFPICIKKIINNQLLAPCADNKAIFLAAREKY